MTTIDRLGITGIRSYGTEKETFIRFYRPLTIILGRNGSGKSTIIEAVKMATTGDLPPMVANGAAFIHDPRIDNETETKAKIRLQFTNARGDEFVVSRHFMLSIKRGLRGAKYKTEFKTIDQTLKRSTGEGKPSVTSFRCNDLNTLLPEIMRVNKPILNNVIFVHQEDSLWPLGDPKRLKEKFDDIFAATRYTKALEEIRKFRKIQSEDLKLLAKDLMAFESKVKELDKLHGQADFLRDKQNKLRRGSQSVKSEIEILTREKESATDVVNEFNRKMREHEDQAREVKHLIDYQSELKSHVEAFIKDLDDAGLELELQKNRERLRSIEAERFERKQAMSEKQRKIEHMGNELKRRSTKRGELEAQDRAHKDNIEKLNLMKKFMAEGGLPTTYKSRLPIYEATLDEWSRFLSQAEKEMERENFLTKEQCRKAESEAITVVTDMRVKSETLQSILSNKTTSLAVINQDVLEKRRRIMSMGDVRANYIEAKERESVARKLSEDRKKSSKISELTKKKAEMQAEQEKVQNELEETRVIRSRMESDREARMKVELRRKNLASKQHELRKTTEFFRDSLLTAIREMKDAESVVAGYVAPSGINDVDRFITANVSEENLAGLREELLEASQNISLRKDSLMRFLEQSTQDLLTKKNLAGAREVDLKKRLSESKAILKSKELALGRARDHLLKLPQVESFPSIEELSQLFQRSLVVSDSTACSIMSKQIEHIESVISSVDKDRTIANQRVSIAGAVPNFWKGLISRFEKDPSHSCPACGLSSAKRVEGMRAHMQSELTRVEDPQHESNIRDVVEKLEQCSDALRKVRDAGSSVVTSADTYSPLKDAWNEAVEKCKNLGQQYDEALATRTLAVKRLGTMSAVSSLSIQRTDIARINAELFRSEKELISAQNNLPKSGSTDCSIEEVTSKITSFEFRLNEIFSEREKLEKLVERERSEIDRATDRLSRAIEHCITLQKQGDEYERTDQDIKKLVDESRKLEQEITEFERKVRDQQEAVEHADQNSVAVQTEQQRVLDSANKTLTELKQKVRDFNNLFHRVHHYSSSGKKDELPMLLKAISDIEEELNVVKTDHSALLSDLDSTSTSESRIEATIQNLVWNQKYRHKEQQINVTRRNMKHIQDELNRIRGQVEGGDPNVKLQRIENKIGSHNESLMTTMAQFELYTEQYKQKKEELADAEKTGGRKQYIECRIQKQTMELASVDLDKYHRALDQALMAFHTLKMNSINRIIKELWQQTYRGTDIDEIEITSDAGEALGNSNSSTARRNYNYRVMMRQGQAMLDMRGRCSAGQKVLACLVIRLALAESFCTDCGILALDEPTTNLDQENVESLATALKRIIEIRRKQRNFQLVLITHDRDFIDMIGARDFASEFYMVFKDANGISHAKVQDLHQLPE